MASGISNQNKPGQVWLNIETPFIRAKYSKSGVILPITRPDNENQRLFTLLMGITAAGCAKHNGITMYTVNSHAGYLYRPIISII